MDNKLPYKVFGIVIAFVSIITFFIMNYNSVPVSFIFFTVKLPLTILFFVCFIIGMILASLYWYQKYKTLAKKYERTEKLLFTKEQLEEDKKDMMKEDLNRDYLKNDVYISAQTLTSVIKYYLKKEKRLAVLMDVDYFISLAETLAKMKNVRNTLAHELKSISREDFNRESETTIEQINSKILDFFNKFYTPLGYKKEMVEVYDNINKEIMKLLK